MILEDLNGIRKPYRKGYSKSKKYRSRLNGWPFYDLRRQIEHKSTRYNGISVIKIKPNKTSLLCSICVGKVIPEENRQIRHQCGRKEDRDINAARNNLYGMPVRQLRGLRLRPDALSDTKIIMRADTLAATRPAAKARRTTRRSNETVKRCGANCGELALNDLRVNNA